MDKYSMNGVGLSLKGVNIQVSLYNNLECSVHS